MESIIKLLPQNHFGQLGIATVKKLVGAESVTVTGAPGFGKVFFPQFIKHQLEKNIPGIEIVRLNLNLIYENSLDHVLVNISKQLSVEIEMIDKYFIELSEKKRIVIIVEGINDSFDPRVLRFLDEIRNINFSQIALLIVGDYTILHPSFISSSKASSLFINMKVIQPFDLEGIERIVEVNNQFYNWNVPKDLCPKLLELSGGSPAIVKEISALVHENFTTDLDVRALLLSPSLITRLHNIALPFIKESLQVSKKLGIVDDNGMLKSELVRKYISTLALDDLTYFVQDLSTDEKRLLTIFLLNKEEVVSVDKISHILKQGADNFSLWAIYKSIQRLRKKISSQFEITSVKGRGYIIKSVNKESNSI